jgi:hypothetical protein
MLDFISTLLQAHLLEPLTCPEAGVAIVLNAALFLEATKLGSGKTRKQTPIPDGKRRANHHYHSHIHLWIGE